MMRERKLISLFSGTGLVFFAVMVAAGCGTPAGDGTGGAGGVVPLGPSPIGDGDQPDGGDPGDSMDGAPDTNGNDNGAEPDEPEPGGGDGDGGNNDNADDDGSDGFDFADGCEAVRGRAFFSGNLSLSFSNTLFSWITSDGLVSGAYTCNGFQLLGIAGDAGQIVGDYEPSSDRVTWQGVVYLSPG